MGRPSSYTDKIAAEICDRMANGQSLRRVCSDPVMPSKATVMNWLNDPARKSFLDQYVRARELLADYYAEDTIDIADEEVTMIRRDKHQKTPKEGEELDDLVEVVFDPTAVARNRLRVDARKWYASKLAPKKYGDKLELAGDPDSPLIVQINKLTSA